MLVIKEYNIMKIRILPLALLAMFLFSCSVTKRGHEVGMQAPAFSLTDINDREVRLESLRGKIVLIDLWSKG